MGRIVLVKGGFPLALGYELTQGGEEPCVCQGGHCDLVCPSVGASPRGRLQLEVLRPGHRPETELHAITSSGCCAWLLTQRVARQAVT